jgi:hypothetical protein
VHGGVSTLIIIQEQIANLRIYKKALFPEEIKEDMNDDLTAIAAFNLAYPLDFNLYEGDNKESSYLY